MPATYYTTATGVKAPLPVTPHHHDSVYASVEHTHPLDDTGLIPLPLTSDWFEYGSGWSPTYYRRHLGIVYLSGLARRTASVPANFQAMATLPAGFRPAGRHIFVCPVDSRVNGEYIHAQRVDVYPDGSVYPQYYTAFDGDTFLSLDPIAFFAEQ